MERVLETGEYEQYRRRLVPEASNVSSSTQGSDPEVDYEVDEDLPSIGCVSNEFC
ncbi:hypothetical protein [Ktedonobacter robiniae]|uniref:hypothetical protein n=1 Tax=Ktedonobacter robiniae TaxID=2778365 RepID=UPI0019159646|nr:hypothetical protein [Ktedonobacter robiniae]